MHTTQKIIIFVCLLITFSCVTNPPNSPDVPKTFEKVFINSNFAGAEIFVDDVSTGQFTPDTISVEVGSRVIKLVKENHRSNSRDDSLSRFCSFGSADKQNCFARRLCKRQLRSVCSFKSNSSFN